MTESALLLEEAAAAMIEAGIRLYRRGMVAANDGNISCRLGDGTVLTTPTGVSKGYMTREMLVQLSPEGKILFGEAKPSTEAGLHLKLYQNNPKIGAVVHAHPPYATAFACSGKTLDVPILPEAVVNLGEIPLLPYYPPGSRELAEAAGAFALQHQALLMANHGALTWGKDIKTALFRMEALEHTAQILFYALQLGSPRPLNKEQVAALKEQGKGYQNKCTK